MNIFRVDCCCCFCFGMEEGNMSCKMWNVNRTNTTSSLWNKKFIMHSFVFCIPVTVFQLQGGWKEINCFLNEKNRKTASKQWRDKVEEEKKPLNRNFIMSLQRMPPFKFALNVQSNSLILRFYGSIKIHSNKM